MRRFLTILTIVTMCTPALARASSDDEAIAALHARLAALEAQLDEIARLAQRQDAQVPREVGQRRRSDRSAARVRAPRAADAPSRAAVRSGPSRMATDPGATRRSGVPVAPSPARVSQAFAGPGPQHGVAAAPPHATFTAPGPPPPPGGPSRSASPSQSDWRPGNPLHAGDGPAPSAPRPDEAPSALRSRVSVVPPVAPLPPRRDRADRADRRDRPDRAQAPRRGRAAAVTPVAPLPSGVPIVAPAAAPSSDARGARSRRADRRDVASDDLRSVLMELRRDVRELARRVAALEDRL